MEIYWTYERDGEIYDADFKTMEAAQERADIELGEKCQFEGERYAVETITLVEFYYDDDGERVIHQCIESEASYEVERGDFEEHGYRRGL